MLKINSIDDVVNLAKREDSILSSEIIEIIENIAKEKKVEGILQSKVDKEIFDFSNSANYPITMKDLIKIVYQNNLSQKPNVFDIANFFGIQIQQILDSEKDWAYLHTLLDEKKIVIGHKDFPAKENLNEFLVAHELGHLFNHHLMGIFFGNETYQSTNHKKIDAIAELITNQNIQEHKIANVTEYIREKASCSNEINKTELEADIFAFNMLYFPSEITTDAEAICFFQSRRADLVGASNHAD